MTSVFLAACLENLLTDVFVGCLFDYSKSHFKFVTFALHVFRSLLKQFSSDFHEI